MVGQRWIGGVAAVILALVLLTACGGGGTVSSAAGPSIEQEVACLKRAGGTAESLEIESGAEMAGATAANGDTLFIVRLPSSDLAEQASRAIKEAIGKHGQTGLMVHSTVDHGLVLVLVIGVDGVDGGAPSQANEELARECAVRPHSSVGEPA